MLGDVDGNAPVVPEAAPCAAQHGVALTDARRPSSHNLRGRSAPRRVDDRRRAPYAVIRARRSDSSARSSATCPSPKYRLALPPWQYRFNAEIAGRWPRPGRNKSESAVAGDPQPGTTVAPRVPTCRRETGRRFMLLG